jgi:predicted RNA binding protein YcfA (HicA-like mRNA interferase family)
MPGVSGQQVIKAMRHAGWEVVGQRGDHARLWHAGRLLFITVPLHEDLKGATLSGILADAIWIRIGITMR